MSCGHSENVLLTFSECLVDILRMSCGHSQNVLWTFSECLVDILRMYTTRSSEKAPVDIQIDVLLISFTYSYSY